MFRNHKMNKGIKAFLQMIFFFVCLSLLILIICKPIMKNQSVNGTKEAAQVILKGLY